MGMKANADGWTRPGPMQILVVEDNYNDVALIKRGFRQCEPRPKVVYAKDGEEAFDVLFARREFEDTPRPDILITNLNMPKFSGHELLEQMKADERFASIPVIVLTMSEREEDIVRAYSHDAAGFFSKPVDKEEFFSLIKAVHDYWQACSLPA
jgi:CheY-like chemotaxis protein